MTRKHTIHYVVQPSVAQRGYIHVGASMAGNAVRLVLFAEGPASRLGMMCQYKDGCAPTTEWRKARARMAGRSPRKLGVRLSRRF